MNLINKIKNMTTRTKKVKESELCEVCNGKGRVSDKESCGVCEGTGVKR